MFTHRCSEMRNILLTGFKDEVISCVKIHFFMKSSRMTDDL